MTGVQTCALPIFLIITKKLLENSAMRNTLIRNHCAVTIRLLELWTTMKHPPGIYNLRISIFILTAFIFLLIYGLNILFFSFLLFRFIRNFTSSISFLSYLIFIFYFYFLFFIATGNSIKLISFDDIILLILQLACEAVESVPQNFIFGPSINLISSLTKEFKNHLSG